MQDIQENERIEAEKPPLPPPRSRPRFWLLLVILVGVLAFWVVANVGGWIAPVLVLTGVVAALVALLIRWRNHQADERTKAETEPPRRRPGPLPTSGSRLGVRHIMLVVLVCALALWVVVNVGWWIAPVLVLAGVVGGIVAAIAILIRRAIEQRETMMFVVARAAEKQLPIGPAIEAFGDLCGGSYRWRALAVARLLDRGQSLPEALERVPGTLPSATRIYARMGWPPALLARALSALAEARAARAPFRRALLGRAAYLGWVLFVLQAILGYSMFWIMPKYEAIFSDFGIQLPAITESMILVSHIAIDYGIVLLVLLAQLLLLLALPMLLFDPMQWNLWPLDWWFRRQHGAAVLRVLSMEVEAGRPLPRSLEVLSHRYPSRLIRRRLGGVLRWVERGQDWPNALRAWGLIRRADVAVLESAQRAGNLPWALGALADGVERRAGYRLLAWAQILFPIAILALGVLVFLFAVAYFVPLVTLIQELA